MDSPVIDIVSTTDPRFRPADQSRDDNLALDEENFNFLNTLRTQTSFHLLNIIIVTSNYIVNYHITGE